MPLVNSDDILRCARENRFAVGAFNADNMEMVQAIIEVANEERAPVIVQIAPRTIDYAGLASISNIVKAEASEVDVPVVLHLDHGVSYEQNITCLCHGFTSLMFDGSGLSFINNVKQTAEIVRTAHTVGIPVEAELGKVLQANSNAEHVVDSMTDPDQASEFVKLTGCDSLAIAVGSVHRQKERNTELDIERIRAIRDKVSVPLVLHGSSGVKHDCLVAAIENGLSKINVGTYLKQGFIGKLRKTLDAMPDEVDLRMLLAPAKEETKERVREKIRLFGASNKITASGTLRDSY